MTRRWRSCTARCCAVARHELGRRRGTLGMINGPEFDDLVHQAAHDAMMNILAKVGEFRGESRFITWAYKFVVFEVSAKASRHAWQRQPPRADDDAWARLSDSLSSQPPAQAEQQELLRVLTDAVASDLTPRQREVFVAVALNDVPIDVLAVQLGSNRNAIYKTLFRRAAQTPSQSRGCRAQPAVHPGDPMSESRVPSTICCEPRTATRAVTPVNQSSPNTSRSSWPAGTPGGPFPGMALHLRSCPACRADHDGLLEAVRRFGDLSP